MARHRGTGAEDQPFTGTIVDRNERRVPADEVTNNLVEFERLERTSRGLKLFGRALVEGLSGGVDSILFNAMTAAGVPRFGEMHALGIPVSRLSVRMAPDSSKNAFVDIEYGIEGDAEDLFDQDPGNENAVPRLEVSSTLVSVRTELEINSNGDLVPIIVKFTPPSASGEPANPEQEQSASVDLMIATSVVRFYRRERNNPQARAKLYIGHVNSDEVFGDPAHTWLISRYDGVTVDRGHSYNVTYEFQRSIAVLSDDSWKATVTFKDEHGRTHKDATVGNGVRRDVRVYRTANFESLNLFL